MRARYLNGAACRNHIVSVDNNVGPFETLHF